MAMITVRNLPDEVLRALRVRASLRGRSTEAEVRAILTEAASPEAASPEAASPEAASPEAAPPEGRMGLGKFLLTIGQHAQLTDEEVACFARRDPEPTRPIDLE